MKLQWKATTDGISIRHPTVNTITINSVQKNPIIGSTPNNPRTPYHKDIFKVYLVSSWPRIPLQIRFWPFSSRTIAPKRLFCPLFDIFHHNHPCYLLLGKNIFFLWAINLKVIHILWIRITRSKAKRSVLYGALPQGALCQWVPPQVGWQS